MGTADLHIHSLFSDGTASVSAILHHASAHTDLDVIAITDHDTLEGALLALEMAPHFRVAVVPGMEISTREGHLLALFLETPVKAGMPFVETAQRVRLFGGLPFAAHPLNNLASSIGANRLRQIVQTYPGLLAGIEAENGAVVSLRNNAAAQTLRWELGLSGIGNSDAHILQDIGCARTAFAGQSVADLRASLDAGTATPLPVQRTERFFQRAVARFALRFGAGVAEVLDVNGGMGRKVRMRRLRAPRLKRRRH